MDLDTLIATIQSNTGRTDKDEIAELGVKFGLTKISQEYPFDQLRKEISIDVPMSATSCVLPANLDEIIELRLIVPAAINMSYSMDLRRKTWFVKKFPNVPNTIITGRPYWCYREGNELFFDRVSDGTYQIKLTGFTTGAYFSGSDESPLSGSDETLIAYGTKHVYQALQMYSDAAYWMNEFRSALSSLLTQKKRETGVHLVAEEWSWSRPVSPNQPWFDPFQDQNTSYA